MLIIMQKENRLPKNEMFSNLPDNKMINRKFFKTEKL